MIFFSLYIILDPITVLRLLPKEPPWVNRTYALVGDKKSQLVSFSVILLEFCSILVKDKNLQFTEFHSLFTENFEEKSFILPLYLMENGKFFNSLPPPPRYSYFRLAWQYIHKRNLHNKWGPVSWGGGNVINDFWYFGNGDEGDTNLKCYNFDKFTLSININ